MLLALGREFLGERIELRFGGGGLLAQDGFGGVGEFDAGGQGFIDALAATDQGYNMAKNGGCSR